MARQATARIPVRPDTKDLLDEAKPAGMTYDLWVRRQLGYAGDGDPERSVHGGSER